MPSTHLSLHYHLAFSTKIPEAWFSMEQRERIHRYLGGIIRGMDGVAHAVGGTCAAGGCEYDTAVRVILDTNVLVAGLKSALGASYRLISLVKAGQMRPAVTTPLVLEYESVLNRPGMLPVVFGPEEITGLLDWFVSVPTRHRVHYLWRPRLPDPKDDLLLER